MAEKFKEWFTELALKQYVDKNAIDPLENIVEIDNKVNNFANVSEDDVEQIILQLKDVGVGIAGINSKLFNHTYKTIIPKLCYFFNVCLTTGSFPKTFENCSGEAYLQKW